MISLEDAIKTISDRHPNEYIHCINEFNYGYEFCMIPNGLTISDVNAMYDAPFIDKQTGKYEIITLLDERMQGNYIQYAYDDNGNLYTVDNYIEQVEEIRAS